jgi:SAM-dependent methyltransferase
MDRPLRWNADELADRYGRELDIDVTPFLKCGDVTLVRDLTTGVWMFEGCDPGDGNFYRRLSQRPFYYMDEKWEFDESIAMMCDRPRDIAILEIGCGNGAFLDRCVDAGFTNVTGMELSESAIAHCRRKGHAVIDTMIQDIAKTDQRFDRVFAFQVLEHVPDPAAFLLSATDVLSSEGQLIVTTPNKSAFHRRYRWNLLDLPPHHMSRWDAQSYRTITQSLGLPLRQLHDEPLARYHYRYYTNSLIEHLPRRSIRRSLMKLVTRFGFAMYPFKKSIQGHTIMAVIGSPMKNIQRKAA